MAKFRPVPSLSPEDAFIAGAKGAPSAEGNEPPPLAIVTALSETALGETAPGENSEDDLEMVSLTVRIRRRHYDQLAKLAAAEERSLSQVARRILEPAIETRSR